MILDVNTAVSGEVTTMYRNKVMKQPLCFGIESF